MTSETVSMTSSPSVPETAPVSAWERFCFASLRLVLHLMARCLTLPGLYRFGRCFGTLEWVVNFRRRRRFVQTVRGLMGDALTDRQIRAAGRRQSMRVRCDKIIYLIFDLLPPEKTIHRWELRNREVLDESLARGKGVYLSLSHHGTQQITGLMLALLGYKVAGVRDSREGALRRYIQSMYERCYPELEKVRIIYSGAFPRDIYRCFQNNFILGSSLDVHRERDSRLKHVDVTFFGQSRKFLVGPVQIALRCGAPILQVFLTAERDFRYRAEILGPLTDRPDEPETPEVLQQIVQRYADNIENFLRRHPEEISRI